MSFRSKEPHNFLRCKSSKKGKKYPDEMAEPPMGRSGRRNTLPNLFPDGEDLQSMLAKQQRDKQKSQEDLKLPAVDKGARSDVPFLDSLIKRKNKLRQSFHGTLSSSLPSSNKLLMRHGTSSGKSGKSKAGSSSNSTPPTSCENSPFMKRVESTGRFRRKEPSDSFESAANKSLPSTPNTETVETASVSKSMTDEASDEPSGALMEGLARQALLAARVFHLIPVERARERNFLQGRIASVSLMGKMELEKVLPHREVSIFVATWNMNGQQPPKDLNDLFLPAELEHVPDIMVVGTQESFPEKNEWEVQIQETLGPSHVLFHSAVFGVLHICIFMRRDLIWFCSIPEEANVSTRTAAAFRTKGAVAIGFLLFGTSFLFICSHLTAHADKVKERVHDARRIIGSLELPRALPLRCKSKDATQNYDCVVWSGDLNFRLDQSREDVVQWACNDQAFPADVPLILNGDQLRQVMEEGSAFNDFQEGPITFPPTYKYDPGTDHFDTSSKRRTPAYTDRILFRSRLLHDLECRQYSSAHQVLTSDHKPVWALFRAKLRPGKDSVPLAGGQFNREVYMEGMKRRVAAMEKRKGHSLVCSVQ
ncbi:inositol polyphosphate 5-phosphatase E [Neocloeon triangulifer]|uniref:inositol polyphosphate 5-phosphatase E n=1 Tax=Neocloeon triangulifer TaxID=2078957 RepID=UPI00286F2D15|nr:inositol polyphosphate 5-phosphatase E [Neocloeon triangulifer]